MPALRHEDALCNFGNSDSLWDHSTFIQSVERGFSLKAIHEKTESFENALLKQSLLSAHPPLEKFNRSEIGVAPVAMSNAEEKGTRSYNVGYTQNVYGINPYCSTT
jgi:hypothetical protein